MAERAYDLPARTGALNGIRQLPGLIAALAALFWVFSATPSLADGHNGWTGLWDTRWLEGGDRIRLSEEGNRVTGTFSLFDGAIEGEANGRRLSGTWRRAGRSGAFLVVRARDGQSFSGRFGDGAWWTGARADEAEPALAADQADPASVMRSFLRISYESGGGAMDSLARAARLVVPDASARREMNLIDYARLLYAVVDRMTFRMRDFPSGQGADAADVALAQAGTAVTMPLSFLRIGDRWFIEGPPVETLRAVAAAAEEARPGAAGALRDPADLSSPRATFRTFLSGMKTFGTASGNPAFGALDASAIPAVARRDEIALYSRYLHEVIDRVGFIYWQEIPDDPESLTPYVHFEHPAGDVVVAPRTGGEADGTVWQFTPATLAALRAVYAAIDELPLPPELAGARGVDSFFLIRDRVRASAPSLLLPLGPMERWQWIALAVLLGLGVAAGLLASRLARHVAPHRYRPSAESLSADRLVFAVIRLALGAIVLGALLLSLARLLGLPEVVAAFTETLGWLLVVLGLVPVVWELLATLVNAGRGGRTVAGHHETLISLTLGLARIALVVVAAFVFANQLDIPYQGVIAGLGIGGLAVALAIQPMLQNFLSGFILYADHPLAVGDFCRFGDRLGTVEHVGIRSTRIRSLDRTVISIPNSEFANLQLENYARRDRMWLSSKLQLRYETTPDQLRQVLVTLRAMLIAHPKVLSEPMRVRFVGFGEHSLDLEVFAYVDSSDYDEFLAIREDIFFRIMTAVEDCGAQFAFPSMVHYQAEDRLPDPAVVAGAEAEIALRRAESRLPFPDFPWQEKAELRDTLAYPPEGSAMDKPAAGKA